VQLNDRVPGPAPRRCGRRVLGMGAVSTEPDEAASALTVKRDTTASRQRVWDVIADGWTYSQWVVGTSWMRAVDRNWPQPSSTIHHSVGIWPALLNDNTEVLASTPGRELVLLAKASPGAGLESRSSLTWTTERLSDRDG